MFSLSNERRLGSITVHPALRRAANLARAFILLEDDELSGPRTPVDEPEHPHRVPLRFMGGTRRPGAGVPRAQICVSPVQRTAGPVRVARCARTSTPH
jgi:hypothetical protein